MSMPASAMARVRSILLSDIHLGTRACQPHRLLEFLREYENARLPDSSLGALRRYSFGALHHFGMTCSTYLRLVE